MDTEKQWETIVELEKKVAPLQLFYTVRRKPAAKFLDPPRELRDQIYDEVVKVRCNAIHRMTLTSSAKNSALSGYTHCQRCKIREKGILEADRKPRTRTVPQGQQHVSCQQAN